MQESCVTTENVVTLFSQAGQGELHRGSHGKREKIHLYQLILAM